jgi:hypothetical protein
MQINSNTTLIISNNFQNISITSQLIREKGVQTKALGQVSVSC